MSATYIHVKGARQHNLKNIEVKIPREKFVVITGVSGSGKSSLALDTIYAEGQRRYVESLSAYARQFLELMDKPEVDFIEGLSPAISIEQKTVSRNPRSTVATVTEIYDYLRLLYARVGHVFCYNCNQPIESQTVQQMHDQVMALPEGTRVYILAPLVRGRKGEYGQLLEKMRGLGYNRVLIDNQHRLLEDNIVLDKKKKHHISVFIDRLSVKDKAGGRIADSLETAVKIADGLAVVQVLSSNDADKQKIEKELLFSEKFACPHCNLSYAEISPRLFSFNSPFGACEDCNGLGTRKYFDEHRIVPNQGLSVRDGAIVPWAHRSSATFYGQLEAVADHFKFDLRKPYVSLSDKSKALLMNGISEAIIPIREQVGNRYPKRYIKFEGVIPYLEKKMLDSGEDNSFSSELEKYMGETNCSTCKGARLKKEALHVRIGDKNIYEFSKLSIGEALQFTNNLTFNGQAAVISKQILKEISDRLSFLFDVGLDYLTLDRKASTLSGGEGQRIRLATQIGSRLVGVLYILDEPSIGLHERDNNKLIETLKKLRDLGNTVIVVEHDEAMIRSADFVIDLGPAAGVHGGEVIAAAKPQEIIENPRSLTGDYLSGRKQMPIPDKRRKPGKQWLIVKGASSNNLKNVDVGIPVGLFTCVTGVSGSGKSTLILDTVFRNMMQQIHGSKQRSGRVASIRGAKNFDKVIDIDQSPIGRTPRSNPATYTSVFTHIRELFALLPESKMRGYTAGRYSFNVKGGRCEACSGDGIIKIEMHFLPDVYVKCDHCQGRRYNRDTLEILYRGKSIYQVLEMTVNQATEFFTHIPSLKQKLKTLVDVGVGYLTLGQAATTLSGGEAQRIKLAKELSRRSTGRTLYILDEPTTGLHFADISKLLEVLHQLTAGGNTVVVIEHNIDMVRAADYIIDLGPEGGDRGGEIVAQGSPDEVMKVERSYTGQALKKMLPATQ